MDPKGWAARGGGMKWCPCAWGAGVGRAFTLGRQHRKSHLLIQPLLLPASRRIYSCFVNQTFPYPISTADSKSAAAYCTNLRPGKPLVIFWDPINNSPLKPSLQVPQVAKCCKKQTLHMEFGCELKNNTCLFSKYPTENMRGNRILVL